MTESKKLSARQLAKDAVGAAISMKVAQVAKNAIADYTQFESDTIVVKLGTQVVGGIVAQKLSPLTDKAVDKTADFITEKREARKAKKNATEKKD